jgi:hypothetical protein
VETKNAEIRGRLMHGYILGWGEQMNESAVNCEPLRRKVLADLGTTAPEMEELLAFGHSRFSGLEPPSLPLNDEPFVPVWHEYAAEATERGVFPVLREKLVQLRFPIQAGISGTEKYRAATRKGISPESALPGWAPVDPAGLRLFLHQTPAGAIPVLTARNRQDFVTLVRALSMRNEPEPVPESMGATMISGLNNWDRIARYRILWEKDNPLAAAIGGWSAEFSRLIARKELYQDRLIILSEGGYSNVSADTLGLPEGEWLRISRLIRLEHECTHYLTLRLFGSMRNAVHDEFLADYAGIVAALGHYRPEWFLLFMGLEGFPAYRSGGRLENYQANPPVSPGVFTILQRLLKKATENVARWDNRIRKSGATHFPDHTQMLVALAVMHLEELAAEGADRLLNDKLENPASHA